ncbi:ion channel [Paraburkholderia sp. BL6669N2]|uniref:potassium channel family protein n=1 Tax=Paraburkholderia sp. BL6669N2 TaxID=1938807 RepID=UPI000E3AB2DB|nr:potassium channel family protein [Paraburkholderia sp. BL6669N2]REG51025.1 ion channel [Paraburkholderia sp. BL6669N2]
MRLARVEGGRPSERRRGAILFIIMNERSAPTHRKFHVRQSRHVQVVLVVSSCEFSRWIAALYFSIVTFTTTGYGDYHPTKELRLVAAAEALAGYIFFGLFVAVIAASFLKQPKGPTDL